MKNTELMKRYEEETGFTDAIVMVKIGLTKLYFPSPAYVQWFEERFAKSEAKAAAYDRLMSGGKKTLKEWANIFGTPVAVDKNLSGLLRTVEAWRALHGYVGLIPSLLIDFTGDWEDSLTLPDGWEDK